MEVIPAIDLLGGKCVRLYQGDYGQSEVFGDDPAAVAKRWEDEGATRLHLVDLDGAKTGELVNLPAIEKVVKALSIPVQVGGGVRDGDRLRRLLDVGVQRGIMGTVAVEKPDLVGELCAQYPGQVVVGIDARDGWVATKGWLETSKVQAVELAMRMSKLGAAAIIYTDIHRDGTMQGPNLESLKELAMAVDVPVIASGGVSSVTDLMNLLSLEVHGVTGAIVGRAIYTGDVVLREAIRAVGNGRWQDVAPEGGSQIC
ncbi:MAG: 1-(5-phosphoribosyl)-5-[(5-phosphoribosylamino)methylideneamino]imidazole-4-carboxamide isomerase [Alkalinema sp. RU_4_3]|nr:1-(5-phosphoribosyl)-5-[(5-phosphoribosylamino)methylideneamino]imidazole-4-carboxamide isomerase [Alkalinema sp. RU_4_3]